MAITIPNKLWVKPWGSNANYTELTPYLALGGLSWSRNDVDASSAGRTQDSKMHRARLGVKARLDANCTPLYAEDMSLVLTAILPEWLSVKFFDPQIGNYREAKMYSNNVKATFLKMNADGTSYWESLTFPLIEE